jgi:hypothetical protein
MNVQFEYLYRDAGNNKKWGEVIVSNRNEYDAHYLMQKIVIALIDNEFFVADKVNIPDLNFKQHIQHLDHDWHEFSNLVSTSSELTDQKNRDIIEIIELLKEPSTLS